MAISIGVSTRTVSIFATVFVLLGGRPIFVPMLVGALLSMFVLAVLRRKIERCQASHRDCAEGKHHRPQRMLHEANLFVRNVWFGHSMLRLSPHGFTLTVYRCGVRHVLLGRQCVAPAVTGLTVYQ